MFLLGFLLIGGQNYGASRFSAPPPNQAGGKMDDEATRELEKVETEEKEFNQQYLEWLKQYKDWKDQNKSKFIIFLAPMCYCVYCLRYLPDFLL
jgi:hypothetical protein